MDKEAQENHAIRAIIGAIEMMKPKISYLPGINVWSVGGCENETFLGACSGWMLETASEGGSERHAMSPPKREDMN